MMPNGNLWIANNADGIHILNPKTNEVTVLRHDRDNPLSLSNDVVTGILPDNTGNIWVTTWGGGLNFHNPNTKHFGHYQSFSAITNTLSNNIVTAFHESNDENIWIGTEDGLNKFEPKKGSITRYYLPSTFSKSRQNHIFSIESKDSASQASLWIGSQTGLLSFNPTLGKFSKWKSTHEFNEALATDYVHHLTKDKQGTVWTVSYLPYRLFRFNDTLGTFKPIELSSIHHPKKIIADQQQHYWIVTKKGKLYKFDINNQKLQQLDLLPNKTETFPVSLIQCFWKDNQNRQWIGTTKGLYLLKPVLNQKNKYHFQRFTELDGLPDMSIVGILEDTERALWISTHRGLSKLDSETMTFRNYHQPNGLQADFFSENAFLKNPTGEYLYFGGINGFNVFDPKQIKNDTIPPNAVITEVHIVRDLNKEKITPQQKKEYSVLHLFHKI